MVAVTDFLERQIETRQIFDGSIIKVCEDRVTLPSGQEARREYIKHPGTVVIVALLDNGKLLFVRQFRYAHHKTFLELPAGRIDPGEKPLLAAKRELLEETGHVAAKWTPLTMIHPSIGYSDETAQIFVATKLDYLGTEIDQGELLEPTSLPLDGAISSIMNGTITDAKTIAALFYTEHALRSGML